MARARLRRGIELVKLANRIEALKMQEDDSEDSDMPTDAISATDQSRRSPLPSPASTASSTGTGPGTGTGTGTTDSNGKRSLSKTIKGAIFREVVLAKVREMKEQEQTLKVTEEVEKEVKRRSFHG